MHRVRFVNYPLQYQLLEAEIDAAIKRVFTRGDFILRGDVREFEENMAAFIGTKYAVGLNSATDALYFSMLAAGIGAGDEVITVSHTFVATTGAITFVGAKPVFVEIRDDFNMAVAEIERAVTPRTKAILPVHLNGRVCDMDTLMAVAERHNLVVIEDAAQALGGTWKGRRAGSFGLSACFSFYPAKILGTAGDAGLLVTNDESFAAKIRALRDHGRTPEGQTVFGFNSRMDNLHAAILNVKFAHLGEWLERRRELAAAYHERLVDVPGLILPPPPVEEGPHHDVFQNYVVRHPEKERLVAHLQDSGIEILINCPVPVHKFESLALGDWDLPRTERIVGESFSLPMYPELTLDDIDTVCDTIKQFAPQRQLAQR